MTFDQAFRVIKKNGQAARIPSWKANAFITISKDEDFIILTSRFGRKEWQPYWSDFTRNDWEVFNQKD
jgi:hypothetical protein